jgi:hypothetical protein
MVSTLCPHLLRMGPGSRVTRDDPISIWGIDMGDRCGIWANDTGGHSIDMHNLRVDIGYLVTLLADVAQYVKRHQMSFNLRGEGSKSVV